MAAEERSSGNQVPSKQSVPLSTRDAVSNQWLSAALDMPTSGPSPGNPRVASNPDARHRAFSPRAPRVRAKGPKAASNPLITLPRGLWGKGTNPQKRGVG